MDHKCLYDIMMFTNLKVSSTLSEKIHNTETSHV